MTHTSSGTLSLQPFFKRFDTKVKASFEIMTADEIQLEFEVIASSIGLFNLEPLLTESKRQRKDELWKSSCFELFLSRDGQEYTEVNVSPLGHWQSYHFKDYRNGRSDSDRVTVEVVGSHFQKDRYKIRFHVRGLKIAREISIHPVVILSSNGKVDYFAHSHPHGKPDFHNQQYWLKLLTSVP